MPEILVGWGPSRPAEDNEAINLLRINASVEEVFISREFIELAVVWFHDSVEELVRVRRGSKLRRSETGVLVVVIVTVVEGQLLYTV